MTAGCLRGRRIAVVVGAEAGAGAEVAVGEAAEVAGVVVAGAEDIAGRNTIQSM